MENFANSIDGQGARPSQVNADPSEKQVDSLSAEQTRTVVQGIESQETVRKSREKKLDLWMENIKEFIRNIDIKTL